MPTADFTLWASLYSRKVALEAGDVDGYMDAVKLVGHRIRSWLKDPRDTTELVLADPRIEMPSE